MNTVILPDLINGFFIVMNGKFWNQKDPKSYLDTVLH